MPQLTKTEKKILLLIAEGYKDREIAGIIYMSERVARKHLQNMYIKLGAINRPNAVHRAYQEGVLK